MADYSLSLHTGRAFEHMKLSVQSLETQSAKKHTENLHPLLLLLIS